MASKYRPYYPRVQNRPQDQTDYSGAFSSGQTMGKDFAGAIASLMNQGKQDKVANALLSQYYPDQAGTTDPNADLSTDLPETVSPDIGGTGTPDVQGNFQGGAAELQMRQDAAKAQLGIQSVQEQIAQRQAAAALAGKKAAGVTLGGGSSSRWLQGGGQQDGQGGQQRGRGGKAPAYVAGSGDVENDEGTDDFSQIRTDFDNQYGKGAFDQFQAENGGEEQLDKNGNLIGYSITGPKTKAEPDGKPLATVPVQDASMWMQRVNAARNKAGQQPLNKMIGKDSVYGQPQNPGSTAAAGSQTNPIILTSKLQTRSLPFGTWVTDPSTGQTYQKQKPAG
jgi:hypothetical protein